MTEVLTREELWQLLGGETPLVSCMPDPQAQVQPNGIELTLRSVARLAEPGAIGVADHERRVAKTIPLDFDAEGWLHLELGCYRITYNEVIHIAADMVALARPRSSLVRSGVTVETSLWDSAYHGRSESLLIVFNVFGCDIKQNARMIQLVFFKLNKPVAQGYAGKYQGENL
jgi:dUTP pyrophosphatase